MARAKSDLIIDVKGVDSASMVIRRVAREQDKATASAGRHAAALNDGDKNAKKTAKSLDVLHSKWLKIAAGAAAAAIAVDRLTDAAVRGSQAADLDRQIRSIAGGMERLRALTEGTRGQVAETDLAKHVVLLSRLKMTVSEIRAAAGFAAVEAARSGNEVATVMEQVVRALVTGEKETFKTLGLLVRDIPDALRQMGAIAAQEASRIDSSLATSIRRVGADIANARSGIEAAWAGVVEMLTDPDARVRREAIAAGLSAQTVDLRMGLADLRAAIDTLSDKHGWITQGRFLGPFAAEAGATEEAILALIGAYRALYEQHEELAAREAEIQKIQEERAATVATITELAGEGQRLEEEYARTGDARTQQRIALTREWLAEFRHDIEEMDEAIVAMSDPAADTARQRAREEEIRQRGELHELLDDEIEVRERMRIMEIEHTDAAAEHGRVLVAALADSIGGLHGFAAQLVASDAAGSAMWRSLVHGAQEYAIAMALVRGEWDEATRAMFGGAAAPAGKTAPPASTRGGRAARRAEETKATAWTPAQMGPLGGMENMGLAGPNLSEGAAAQIEMNERMTLTLSQQAEAWRELSQEIGRFGDEGVQQIAAIAEAMEIFYRASGDGEGVRGAIAGAEVIGRAWIKSGKAFSAFQATLMLARMAEAIATPGQQWRAFFYGLAAVRYGISAAWSGGGGGGGAQTAPGGPGGGGSMQTPFAGGRSGGSTQPLTVVIDNRNGTLITDDRSVGRWAGAAINAAAREGFRLSPAALPMGRGTPGV